MINNVDHLFIVLICHNVFFREMAVQVFCPVFKWVVVELWKFLIYSQCQSHIRYKEIFLQIFPLILWAAEFS